MDRSEVSARRRAAEVPAKPEAGLAEWTSRIKAMQKQVDDDEEAETRRLEEEIAASRLARMRRSTGRGTSTDLSNSDVARSLKEDNGSSPTPAALGDATLSSDKQRNQEDSLRKLMGESKVRRSEGIPSSSAAAPMSLAAFIGGRATGPRLNKPVPQQDLHDPTQFEQRAITAPHPVFGRGGVAMPGLTGRTRTRDDGGESPKTPSLPSGHKEQTVTPSSGSDSTVKARTRDVEDRRAPSPQKYVSHSPVNDWQSARQRTISTPAPPINHPSPSPTKESPAPRASPSPRPTSYNSVSGDYLSSKPSYSSDRPTPTRQTTNVIPSRTRSISPLQSTPPPRPSISPSVPSPKSPITGSMPGLAKPIQPTPKIPLQGPQIPLGPTASPTFLRPPPAKDPTPSISRLQGRGFVQNMVRASSQLEASAQPSGPSSAHATPEKDIPRKASVLDRWQFNSSPAPVIAPKPVPLRKSRTVDPSSSISTSTSPVPTPFSPAAGKRDTSERSLKPVPSLPSIAQTATPDKIPRPMSAKSDVGNTSSPISQKRGLGSSTTMISYIKPLKTGDNPPTSAPPSRPSSRTSRSRPVTPSPDVDEMGLRVRSRSRPRSVGGVGTEAEDRQAGSSAGVADGKPLSHPTKDRARKPRRAKTTFTDTPLKARSGLLGNHSTDKKVQFSIQPTPAPQRAVSPRLTATYQTSAVGRPDTFTAEKSRDPTPSPPSTGANRRVHFPLEIEPVHIPQEHEKPPRSPVTPIRHTRIPSTGNRATVMDVAQALSEHEEQVRKLGGETAPRSEEQPVDPPEAILRLDVKSMVSNWGASNGGTSPISAEKRKSSYEKYSAFTLPPLVEEKTPASSPANTLSRRAVAPVGTQEEAKPSISAEVVKDPLNGPQTEPPVVSLAPAPVAEPNVEDPYVHFNHVDEPLPKVDIVPLLNFKPSVYKPDADATTISVDVLNVAGSNATPISNDSHVFYETETLAIIYRFKAKSSGLVNTKVWVWRGSKAQAGEREEKKIQELARRYNTSLLNVSQNTEPAEMVFVLGGQLVTRQGTRTHWSRENTAMHVVRSTHGLIYIDEVELSIRNLCSGFSYCVSLLETFYVWHGEGATPEERLAALQYARSLASDPSSIIELTEGGGDEDEMFWLILGEGDYAKADYWKWKPAIGSLEAQMWLVDADSAQQLFVRRASLSAEADVHACVYLLDCIWEYFVLVGSDARGKRRDIRLALQLGKQLSSATSFSKPFRPTVHVLILPSQLPADLRLTFRELDEHYLNRGSVPDHMNLLPSSEAFEQLKKSSWERSLLKDDSMLPLGLQRGQ